jgi:hypothetical protein
MAATVRLLGTRRPLLRFTRWEWLTPIWSASDRHVYPVLFFARPMELASSGARYRHGCLGGLVSSGCPLRVGPDGGADRRSEPRGAETSEGCRESGAGGGGAGGPEAWTTLPSQVSAVPLMPTTG